MNPLFTLVCFTSILFADSATINIDLSTFHPGDENSNVLKHYYNITDRITAINVARIADDVGFFVIQAHTFIENVTLSNSTQPVEGSSSTGTNIGLVWLAKEQKWEPFARFYLTRNAPIDNSIRLLLVINVYDERDPVPGGCNLSFETDIAPYQIAEYTDDVIIVKSQPPSVDGSGRCDDKKVQVDLYHLYLGERDNTIESYFDNIEKMLSVRDIMGHGTMVPDVDVKRKYSRMYSSYRGTGEVFAVISKFGNGTSAYVPAVSYGCDLTKWQDSCLAPVALHWKFFCAFVLFFGLFICFFGHRFFKFTLYIISFSFGLLVTYLVISMEEHFSFTEKTVTAFTVGFIYGIIWLLIWRRFGIPILTVTLAFIMFGFLVASLLFNTILVDIHVLTNPVNFWLAFTSTILLCIIVSMVNMLYGHISSISCLGAYGAVASFCFYVGGNLPYVFINTYRRVAVKDFSMAVVDPPMGVIDAMQIILWVLMMTFGIYVQRRHQMGKPPFPPNRNASSEDGPMNETSETAPLLYPDYPDYVRSPNYSTHGNYYMYSHTG
ncbi:unnamed protein product [Phyllotreta striolata]|uniref:TM7S3/TM198-like domain-containing protein n=1 Tax=Phyllotreta striolata TaxID=444603 RepID=A0A9N9XNW4_PHYSR|nr:unnamed protein product [Phyllotreta striolata]